MALSVSDILALVGDWLSGMTISSVAATISSVAAIISVRFAWLARRRADPVVEVSRSSDSPWQGWISLELWISNSAPADLVIERISVPVFTPGRIVLLQRLVKRRTSLQESYLTKAREEVVTEGLPATPPQVPGDRSIRDMAARIRTYEGRKSKIVIACPPGAGGSPTVPKRLRIRFRWRDQRHRHRTITAHS